MRIDSVMNLKPGEVAVIESESYGGYYRWLSAGYHRLPRIGRTFIVRVEEINTKRTLKFINNKDVEILTFQEAKSRGNYVYKGDTGNDINN